MRRKNRRATLGHSAACSGAARLLAGPLLAQSAMLLGDPVVGSVDFVETDTPGMPRLRVAYHSAGRGLDADAGIRYRLRDGYRFEDGRLYRRPELADVMQLSGNKTSGKSAERTLRRMGLPQWIQDRMPQQP